MTINDAIKNVVETVKPPWVVCPICMMEWSRLRHCKAWVKGQGETYAFFESYICVECAETCKSIKQIADTWPMSLGNEGLYFERILPTACKRLASKYITPGMFQTIIKQSDSFLFRFERRNTGISISGTGIKPDDPIYKENSIDAWFWVRDRFENGEPLETKTKDWNPMKKFKRGLAAISIISVILK